MEINKTNLLAMLALIFGAASALCGILPLIISWCINLIILTRILGIAALVLGIVALVMKQKASMAIIGIVLGVFGLLSPVIFYTMYVEAAADQALDQVSSVFESLGID